MDQDVDEPFVLTLYIAGQTARSKRAIENLRRLCEKELHGRYRLSIVDVVQRPELAEEARVLATPLLLKRSPAPPRRILGDLSNPISVSLGLDIDRHMRPR